MGYSTEQAIDVQDSMSYAFVKNAASAERADSAISAFTKAINTGTVSADQWESITTAIPTVINDIATASGKSAAAVRALGASGKLTASDLTEGLKQSLRQTQLQLRVCLIIWLMPASGCGPPLPLCWWQLKGRPGNSELHKQHHRRSRYDPELL